MTYDLQTEEFAIMLGADPARRSKLCGACREISYQADISHLFRRPSSLEELRADIEGRYLKSADRKRMLVYFNFNGLTRRDFFDKFWQSTDELTLCWNFIKGRRTCYCCYKPPYPEYQDECIERIVSFAENLHKRILAGKRAARTCRRKRVMKAKLLKIIKVFDIQRAALTLKGVKR